MTDYTWPSVYFAYFFFTICLALAVFFFARSWKSGYWGKSGEDVKYQVFDDELTNGDPDASRETETQGIR
jgi:hypothetical protein